MKKNIFFLPVMLLSAFAVFSQQELTPQLLLVKKPLPAPIHYPDYLSKFNKQIDNPQVVNGSFSHYVNYKPKKLTQAIFDYLALKGSIDIAKTKYGDDNYKRDPLARFDIEAIIALAEEMLPNPWDKKSGQNSIMYLDDPAKPQNFLQVRTGLRLHGRGDVQKADGGDTYKTSIYYLALPLYLLYNRRATNDNDRFFAGLGPYYGYALFGKFIDKVNGETTKEKIKFGKDESGIRRGDFGLGFVAGYIYGKILLQLSYDLGLSNIGYDKDFKAFNRAYGFSIGYVLK